MVLEHVNLLFFKVFEENFSKFKFLLLICVKVERSCVFSEGITPTTDFVNNGVDLSSNMVFFAKNKYGVIGEEIFLEYKRQETTTKCYN